MTELSNNNTSAVDKCGAVYVAFGTPYLAMALVSATTLRASNPNLAIQIISDHPATIGSAMSFWDDSIDIWTQINDDPKNNRIYKTNLQAYVDFEKAVYLDSDTIITGDMSVAFKYLEYFDLCARAHRGMQTHSNLAKVQLFDDGFTVQDMPHWNGGVLFFRNNDKTENFFKNWKDDFLLLGENFDQPALAKAMIESDCRILSLDERWNGGFKVIKDDKGGVPIIAHYHSALDHEIENALRKVASKIDPTISQNSAKKVETYIKYCRNLRKKSEPVKSFIRRIYRIYWHKKHQIVRLSRGQK